MQEEHYRSASLPRYNSDAFIKLMVVSFHLLAQSSYSKGTAVHQLTWLHLSDIHFHPALNWRDAHSHETLLKYLEQCFSEDPSLRPDLIFCTGDIAFGETHKAPLAEQYNDAISFFEKLLIVCEKNGTALPKNRLFVVPGNHDVNRKSINSDAQESLYKKTEQSDKYAGTINQRFNDRQIEFQQSMERLKEYADFVRMFLPHQHDADNRVRYAQVIQVNNIKVGIAGLNSAWSCAGDEDDRKLWLAAEWQLNKAREQLHDAEIRIALMHHPIDNLNQNERDLTTRRIVDEFHFLLHGHSHNMWVTTGAYINLAAGAVGAASKDEFGINIVGLDFKIRKGNVHLHKYDKTGWTIAPVPKHAPKGIWEIDLPRSISSAQVPTNPPHPEEDFSPAPATIRLYGRDQLLNEASAKLQKNCLLLLYGMRGNGKTRVIEALATRAPLAGKEVVRIQVDRDTNAKSLFRQFAHMLGDNSDVPRPPNGTVEAVAQELRKRYPASRPAWLWLDRAHLLLKGNGFEKPEVRILLMALNMAFGVQLPLVLELRERPPIALMGRNCNEIEVPGLDKNSLAECLADAAPPTRAAEWHYKGDQLKRVYGWLGGGGGKQAHPLAITLLIEVAKGHDETPIEVLYRHSGDVRQKLEDALLGDLINDVLSENERQLIQALSLYRTAIPYDQVDGLEQQLELIDSWDGIIRRCLLSPNSNGSLYYLHGFTAGWLRATLGYGNGNGNGDDAILDEFNEDASVGQRMHAERLHRAIANCWLEQLGSGKRRTMLDVERAVEAFFHLTAAGDGDNVSAIAVDLLSGNEEWALRRIKGLYEYLYRNSAPVHEQRKVLEYWTILDPNEPKAQRFLGECWIKEEGKASTKALACFENACRLNPDFPQYWTNLGRSLLAQGEDGAQDFLNRLEKLESLCPQAINDFARSVQAHCLTRVGESAAASTLRMRMIAQGSRDPVFYNDEAQARLEANDEKGALEILRLATQRSCTDDFTDAIHANALQKSGDPHAATALRMKKIEAHSRNSVFYADEAKLRLEAGDAAGALEVLNLASQRGCTNEFTEAVRSNALRHLALIPRSS